MLPQLERVVVQGGTLGVEVVGADDGGIAPRVAAADPAFLEHRDTADAMLARQVVRGAEAMSSAADDDHVVLALGRSAPPLLGPASLAGQAALQELQGGKTLHGSGRGWARARGWRGPCAMMAAPAQGDEHGHADTLEEMRHDPQGGAPHQVHAAN